jgi:hypothetical protein
VADSIDEIDESLRKMHDAKAAGALSTEEAQRGKRLQARRRSSIMALAPPRDLQEVKVTCRNLPAAANGDAVKCIAKIYTHNLAGELGLFSSTEFIASSDPNFVNVLAFSSLPDKNVRLVIADGDDAEIGSVTIQVGAITLACVNHYFTCLCYLTLTLYSFVS